MANQIHSTRGSHQEIFGGAEALFLPFLGGAFDRKPFRDSKLVQIDRTGSQFVHDFRNGQRTVEKIFPRLELISRPRRENVSQGDVAIPDDSVLFQKLNDAASAKPPGNL